MIKLAALTAITLLTACSAQSREPQRGPSSVTAEEFVSMSSAKACASTNDTIEVSVMRDSYSPQGLAMILGDDGTYEIYLRNGAPLAHQGKWRKQGSDLLLDETAVAVPMTFNGQPAIKLDFQGNTYRLISQKTKFSCADQTLAREERTKPAPTPVPVGDPNLPRAAIFVKEHCPTLSFKAPAGVEDYAVSNDCTTVYLPLKSIVRAEGFAPSISARLSCDSPDAAGADGGTMILKRSTANATATLNAATLANPHVQVQLIPISKFEFVFDHAAIFNLSTIADLIQLSLTVQGACGLYAGEARTSSLTDLSAEKLNQLLRLRMVYDFYDTRSTKQTSDLTVPVEVVR